MDSNNLPMKQETGLIHKVKMFFYKMLKKDRMEKEPVHINASVPDADKEDFQQILQKDANVINNKRFIIEQIDKYPEILYELPVERLKVIGQLYDEVLEQEEIEIDELNARIEKLKSERLAS
ncbi:MAG: hypothetical protein IKD76_00270 [Clostridia bacterium]|nr:hypothetical protein [Clostridia bacterium]